MAEWINDDGLRVTFGQANVAEGRSSAANAGSTVKKAFEIDLVDAGTAAAVIGEYDEAAIPEGALITGATITVLTAATSGGAAALNVGLTLKDATGGDADGIDAAVALAALTPAGAQVACNGALINTVLAGDRYLSFDYDTAAYTAGRIRVEIEYRPTLNREDQS